MMSSSCLAMSAIGHQLWTRRATVALGKRGYDSGCLRQLAQAEYFVAEQLYQDWCTV